MATDRRLPTEAEQLDRALVWVADAVHDLDALTPELGPVLSERLRASLNETARWLQLCVTEGKLWAEMEIEETAVDVPQRSGEQETEHPPMWPWLGEPAADTDDLSA